VRSVNGRAVQRARGEACVAANQTVRQVIRQGCERGKRMYGSRVCAATVCGRTSVAVRAVRVENGKCEGTRG